MDLLVGNGTKLYRRGNSLVRTPIVITLKPDGMRFCPVGNVYAFQGSIFSDILGNSVSYETLPSGKTREDAAYDAQYEALLGEYTMANRWGANGWLAAQYDMGATLYYGSFDPATAERLYQGYYMNYSASAYMCLAAYHFTVPGGVASLAVNGVETEYRASRAPHFGSLRNAVKQQTSASLIAYGRLGTSLNVSPSGLMGDLAGSGYHMRFRAPAGTRTNQSRVIAYWYRGSTSKELAIPVSARTGPFTGSVESGDVGNAAVRFIDENRSFYLFIFHNWNAGAKPPKPNNLSSAPLWWLARHVYGPKLRLSLGGS